MSTPVGAAIAGLALAGKAIYDNWAGIKAMFGGIADGLASSFPNAVAKIREGVAGLAEWLSSLSLKLDVSAEDWRAFGLTIGSAIADAATWVTDKLGAALQAVLDIANSIRDAIASVANISLSGPTAGETPTLGTPAPGAMSTAEREARVAAAIGHNAPPPPIYDPANVERVLELTQAMERIRKGGSALNSGADGMRAMMSELARERATLLEGMPEIAPKVGDFQKALREAGGQATAEAQRIRDEITSTLNITATPASSTSRTTRRGAWTPSGRRSRP